MLTTVLLIIILVGVVGNTESLELQSGHEIRTYSFNGILSVPAVDG